MCRAISCVATPRCRTCATSSLKSSIATQPGAGSPLHIGPRPRRSADHARELGGKQAGHLFNIGLTYEGLRALGTPGSSLEMFPNEFIEGMTARALKLGDVGQSAPETWPSPFDEPERIHLIATIYAGVSATGPGPAARARDRKALKLLGTREGCSFTDDIVHFGYRDNLMQPRFEGVHDPQRHADGQPIAPLGTVLLGHPTNLEGLRGGFLNPKRWDTMAPSTRFAC